MTFKEFFDVKIEEICKKDDIRYYMGRHKIAIAYKMRKKAMIKHLERGYVGNKKIGYKEVRYPMWDIVLIRHCHRNKARD